ELLQQVNNKSENAITIAARLGFLKQIPKHIVSKADLDHQDNLGNTALYYAIQLKSLYSINILAYNHANAKIKN
ncbi:hypothetical protein BCR36DRAFT_260971, partial [Piromyces finnis]